MVFCSQFGSKLLQKRLEGSVAIVTVAKRCFLCCRIHESLCTNLGSIGNSNNRYKLFFVCLSHQPPHFFALICQPRDATNSALDLLALRLTKLSCEHQQCRIAMNAEALVERRILCGIHSCPRQPDFHPTVGLYHKGGTVVPSKDQRV